MTSKRRARHHIRFLRLFRLAVHALRGWLTSFRLARIDDPARREQIVRGWSQRLFEVLGMRVVFHDAPEKLPRGAVLVANHLSWLDVFAVYTHTPGQFVSKAEVRDWPLIGGVVVRAGTIFIERGSARHARNVNSHIAAALNGGAIICVFPEGVAGEGDVLHSFHGALFQPAIEGQATVVPIALRYTDSEGRHNPAPNYAGETTLLQSLWSVLSHTGLNAELHFLPHVSAANAQRRELARHTESLISERLGIAIKRKHNETRADPPDAQQSAALPTHNPYPAPADSA